MKNLSFISSLIFCIGCSEIQIKPNDSSLSFRSFPQTDSVKFTTLSDELLEEPTAIKMYQDYLILQSFNKGHGKWISIFSLKENRIIKDMMDYGQGPEEMLGCSIGLLDNKIWLYDITKKQIGMLPVDSFLTKEPLVIPKHELDRYYYTVAMTNDSIMLGSNDLTSTSKISYVNLNTGKITGRGDYASLPDMPLAALMDAAGCYIDVHPETKEILLAYRYTDVIEIYTPEGELKHALHGPMGFDIKFHAASDAHHTYMAKTGETRKAFVGPGYVTAKHIYLLFSGCKRNEAGWSTGSEIFVYSWDGQPLKRYLPAQSVLTFTVDEARQTIYAYAPETEELIKGNI